MCDVNHKIQITWALLNNDDDDVSIQLLYNIYDISDGHHQPPLENIFSPLPLFFSFLSPHRPSLLSPTMVEEDGQQQKVSQDGPPMMLEEDQHWVGDGQHWMEEGQDGQDGQHLPALNIGQSSPSASVI